MAPKKMIPRSEDGGCRLREAPLTGHEVVISGIAGKFPDSDNVRDFMRNLYGKVDMVSSDDRRWVINHPDIPNPSGKINNMGKFDAQFFGVHYKQAACMDPMHRTLLETTYAAIIDAGLNPRDLRSTKTGVFIGVSTSDAEKTWFYENTQISGLGLTGTARAMLSNRISYWLGAQGPSYTLHAECSSTMLALEHAYNAIRTGLCDAALIGGTNFCAHPFLTLQLNRMGVLSEDGRTRCFDKNATGYGRAETIGVIFLQRAKDAKRAYLEVVHAKSTSDGFGSSHATYSNKETQRAFLEEFYREVDVLPSHVQYIETFGAGILEVDKNELDAIEEVFCKGRQEPLLVGCVKSNMGHAEAASGVAAVTKICLAYHKGEIAPNLHYNTPRSDVACVREGRVRVVTEPTRFSCGYTATSSYSFTGVNVHVLFKGLQRRNIGSNTEDLPRLVTLSGRMEESLKTILGEMESLPLSVEQIRLLNNIHEKPIQGHVFRGYNIIKINDCGTARLAQQVDYFPGLKRPVWFVYSGMGSQWSGMGAQLMRIPVFAAAIERCCRALAPKGVDLMRILTDPDPTMYDNILHSFVGIAAVQIGLTDTLVALGIQPDNIIGHSVGELGCAYADGCFTAEEMILSAYSRGLVSVQTPFVRGSMAAVGMGYDQIKYVCPPEVEVACHNGPDSCTISGPADVMKSFVGELTQKGIFAKEVPCSNIAYHSKYIAEAGPELLKYLQDVIKNPKPRSDRWLSTSVPQNQWNHPSAKLCSAEYHTNNLLRPVLFEETSRLIPSNAITIEVAPHGLLQAILRRSLADCIHVPLTKRHHADNVTFLLNAVGKLFMNGLDPKIANIYPAVQLPVSAETPLMSHMVGWEHSEDWLSHGFYPKIRIKSGERHFVMSTCDEEHKFLRGHVVDGVNTFPAAGYLTLAWETLAMMQGKHYSKVSVMFEGVHFESDAVLRAQDTLELVIMIHKADGHFEITAEGGIVASGRITSLDNINCKELGASGEKNDPADDVTLSADNVYRVLKAAGYSYSDEFRSIESANIAACNGRIKFNNNWVTFLDGILQMNFLRELSRGIHKAKHIRKLSIDTKRHLTELAQNINENKHLELNINELYDCVRCGGVELEGLVLTTRARRAPEPPLLQAYTFMPYSDLSCVTLQEKDCLDVQLQIATQNNATDNNYQILFVTDKTTEHDDKLLINVRTVMEESIGILNNIKTITEVNNNNLNQLLKNTDEIKKVNLVILSHLLSRKNLMEDLSCFLDDASFVLSRELVTSKIELDGRKLEVVSVRESSESRLILLKKRSTVDCSRTKYVTVKSGKMSWLQLLEVEWRACDRIVLVSDCDPCAGLLGFFNSARREPGGHVLTLLLIDDCSAPAFRPDLPFYRKQLAKNLPINVYRNGAWGSYQYLPLSPVSVNREHVYLASQRPEDISSLAWIEGPLAQDTHTSGATKKLVQMYYSSVSHMDVLNAAGRQRIDNVDGHELRYGMDFCGRTIDGERVMGLVLGGAMSSLVQADVELLWPVPPHWSMEDAATVPLAYATVAYCLISVTFNRLFDSFTNRAVLIDGGETPLGQAAISVCLGLGYTVYTTVDSLHKKRWLLKFFPALRESNVGNSNEDSFEDMVMIGTKGKGCHLIINTSSGRQHKVSVRCMAQGCIFINTDTYDMVENSSLGMYMFLRGSYTARNIINLFKKINYEMKKKVQQIVAEGIARGYVRPLSRVVLDASEATRAFRLTSTRRHVGHVLLKLRDEELRPLVTPPRTLLPALPHFLCSGHGNYVVLLGPEHSGLELADWLVQRGAKNLLLHSPLRIGEAIGDSNGYQAFRVRRWRQQGVQVQLSAEDLRTETGCLQLLTDSAKQAPVLGLFVTPRSSHRRLFEHTPSERMAQDFETKALIVVNFDSAARKLCPELQQFVVWTCAAAGHGEMGCNSDALADSVLERICEERGKLGLAALAVQLSTEPRDITNGLDQLLVSKHNVVAVSTWNLHTTNKMINEVLTAVADIIGVKNLEESNDGVSLQHYGVDISTAREIQCVFERKFHIFRTPGRIMSLTIAELKELQSWWEGNTKRKPEGLGMFFNSVDPEEYKAGEPLVRMPTLLSDGCETEEEMYEKGTYLLLIPGMDGHRNIFSAITQRLKLNAFTCQLEFDNFEDSTEDMAARMTQIILKKIRPDGKFLLMGYSFGVNVALEVAANLEEKGLNGQVFCLDGSPRWFAALLEEELGHPSEQRLQAEVILHMFRVMTASHDSEEALQRSLAAETDWEAKLNACLRHLHGRVNFSFQYQRSLIEMAYARIRQARAYSDARLLSRPLRSELVLLKAMRRSESLSATAEALGKDLGLGAYTHRPVAIYELDCDHAEAPFDLSVSEIINARIADLQHFSQLNLCDTYVINTKV